MNDDDDDDDPLNLGKEEESKTDYFFRSPRLSGSFIHHPFSQPFIISFRSRFPRVAVVVRVESS